MAAADPIVSCPACGKRNRLRTTGSGVPHCGSCGAPLPWLVAAGDADFREVAEKADVPVLVDFWAPWCGPCRIVEPAVEKASRDLAGRLKVVKLNTDEAPATAERFGIRGIPTLALLSGGRERDRVTGALNSPALENWLASRLERAANA